MKNNWLTDFKRVETSQFGEDGILEKIFEVIGVKKDWCVDVGAHGMHNSNTHFLITIKDWAGVVIDSNLKYARRLSRMYQGRDVYCVNQQVDLSGTRTLDHILKGTPTPKEFALLSIDIDGNDYYVWRSLENYLPKVVVIEFNPVMKTTDYLQDVNGKGGSSLSFLVRLGKSKGYELVATTPVNAIFVVKELFELFEIKDNSIEELFTDSDQTYG